MYVCKRNRTFLLLLSLVVTCLGLTTKGSAQDKTLTVRSIAEAPAFAKRALIIGIGEYEHATSLAPTTYNDAKAVADLLQKQFGFPTESIVLMTDAPDTPDKLRPTFIHLKSAISNLLNSINEKSEVVIYFTGHGTRAENHDWLVPLDGLPAEVETTCINYDDFRSRLETKVPARALLIVDACRNLSGGKDAGSSGFGAGKGLTGPQFAELLSCRPKEISQVGKKEDFQESVFTHFLLEGLQGAPEAQSEGVVTFDSLKLFVQGSVSQYVSSKFGESQNPDGRASLGKMVLAKGLNRSERHPEDKIVNARENPVSAEPKEARGGVTNVRRNHKDGVDLVFIGSGPFLMGASQNESWAGNAMPQHKAMLSSYYIYKNLVTVNQFKQFCQATGRPMPLSPSFNFDWQKEDHPMVNVTWEEARDYCRWAGGDLPTEAQWEKAARGTDGRIYPWGNGFDTTKFWFSNGPTGSAGGTTPVGFYGISPYGVTDMAGNVDQWCLDWYDANYYQNCPTKDPMGPDSGTLHTVRGGPWRSHNPMLFRTFRRDGIANETRNPETGFRCVIRSDVN
jgi:sulfatase modifying factor 1